MRKITHTSVFTEYAGDHELDPQSVELLRAARKAGKNAYAPYSGFFVGAALRLGNGTIVAANNQENVAYPSGLCAERVAVFFASANHPGEKIDAIAVSCSSEKTGSDQPFSPCGACRQALAEYEQKQDAPIRILLGGETGNILLANSVKDLLPLVFEAEALKGN